MKKPVRIAPFVAAVVLAGLGHLELALGLVVGGVGLLQLDQLQPDLAGRGDHGVARLARGLGEAVGALALGLVWALIVVPVSILAAALRRNPLGRGRGWAPAGTERGDPRETFGLEPRAVHPPTVVQRLLTTGPLVVGWTAIAVLANYGLGWVWDEVVGGHDRPAAVALAPTEDPAELATRPALRDAPWAADHLAAYAGLDYEYRSFLMEELVDGTYGDITIEDRRRHTYTPDDLPAEAPEVWVFGGSTAFGKAQRDDHTIASELARAAEAAGRPARVLNFGNPGYTSYQQWQLFERALAEGPEPAAAVFLDGTADIEVQAESPTPDPTHFNLEAVDDTITGQDPEVVGLPDLPQRYVEDGLTGRLWRAVDGLVAIDPAGADPTSIGDNAAALGARARLLIDHLAERDGVPVVVVREPAPHGGPNRAAYLAAGRQLPEPMIDLTDLLADRPEVFLDWIHVNEEGARLIAEAVWPELAAALDP